MKTNLSAETKWGNPTPDYDIEKYYGQPRPREYGHKPQIFDTKKGVVLLEAEKRLFGDYECYPLLNPKGKEFFEEIEEYSCGYIMQYKGLYNLFLAHERKYLFPVWVEDYEFRTGEMLVDINKQRYSFSESEEGTMDFYDIKTGECITDMIISKYGNSVQSNNKS